ncbi:glycosyltransferase [Sphingomonas melonis]|uniref:Glycosyltransferase involved in cell wall biosynthesis n=1 Tax=Sphingomonas melonis TaxID=152682 RepID=A0A7Y9K1C8_9SPHN|nr:glycosyltransferase [Sphingomonas melonis]NYD88265.1 glycosyltransferase involved in cell wall biosynthesis [Sphingomonas melonis]
MSADHILTFAQDLSGGGVERAQLRLAAQWLAAGRRVTLAVGDASGPLAADLPAGLAIEPLGHRRYIAQRRLAEITLRLRPDLIFCAGNHYTLVAAWLRWRLADDCPPIVAKLSNAIDRADHGRLMGAGHRLWLAQHGRFLDHLVAMTPATAALAARAMRMERRTSVIPNPPAPAASGATGVAPLPPGRIVLGVGRLVPQKRWDRLIAAVPALPADVGVVILGEGELRPALERQIAAAGLEGRVTLRGHVADPLPAMARAAVLALPSDYEGVPGVLREALSVGTPVVATASSPAVREIVGDPRLGSVIQAEDAAGFAAAINHWLEAPRPAPVPQPGRDSAARYLALFDTLA